MEQRFRLCRFPLLDLLSQCFLHLDHLLLQRLGTTRFDFIDPSDLALEPIDDQLKLLTALHGVLELLLRRDEGGFRAGQVGRQGGGKGLIVGSRVAQGD